MVVPTNGLVGAKAAAMADFIRFVVGPDGQRDIEGFGAAPATSAMVTADLQVAASSMPGGADRRQARARAPRPGASTSTTVATGSAGGAGAGSGAGGDNSGGGGGTGGSNPTSPTLAFTGGPDLAPLVGTGVALLAGGALLRRRLHRRARGRAIDP